MVPAPGFGSKFVAYCLLASMATSTLAFAAPAQKAAAKNAGTDLPEQAAAPLAPAPKESKIKTVRIVAETPQTAEDLNLLSSGAKEYIELSYDMNEYNCKLNVTEGRPCGIYFKAIHHDPSGKEVNLALAAIGKEGLTWLDYQASTGKLYKEYNDLWKEYFGPHGVYEREKKAGLMAALPIAAIGGGGYYLMKKLSRRTGKWSQVPVASWLGRRLKQLHGVKHPVMFFIMGGMEIGAAIGVWRVVNNYLDYSTFGSEKQERLWLSETLDTGQCFATVKLEQYSKGGLNTCLVDSSEAAGRPKSLQSFNMQAAAQSAEAETAQQGATESSETEAETEIPEAIRKNLIPVKAIAKHVDDKAREGKAVEPSVIHPIPRSLAVGADQLAFAKAALKTFFSKYKRQHKDVTYEAPGIKIPGLEN